MWGDTRMVKSIITTKIHFIDSIIPRHYHLTCSRDTNPSNPPPGYHPHTTTHHPLQLPSAHVEQAISQRVRGGRGRSFWPDGRLLLAPLFVPEKLQIRQLTLRVYTPGAPQHEGVAGQSFLQPRFVLLQRLNGEMVLGLSPCECGR